jgi:hypothetical protein
LRTAGKPSEGQYSAIDRLPTWNLRTVGKPSEGQYSATDQAAYLEFENRRKAIRVGQYSATDRLYYLEFENSRKANSRPIFRYRQTILPGV